MNLYGFLAAIKTANGDTNYARALAWCLDDDDRTPYELGDDDGSTLMAALKQAAQFDFCRAAGVPAN